MFGRRHRAKTHSQRRDEEIELTENVLEPADGPSASTFGPYDADAGPDDRLARLDLGSLRLPVPEGAQLQIEVEPSGPIRAVHLTTELGQITLNAFAAPRSGGLWREVVPELVTKLRADGAQVGKAAGEWGDEVEAVTEHGVLRFLAVDGPRWMLRGVAAGPADGAYARTELLRDIVRQTVVVRGDEPLPVRSPLPLQLPGALGEQLRQATAELVNAAAEGGGSGE
ncbi:MAG: DUF3710 domain-containing protein [Actinomycetota bacterium]|nr:DUF3710 domain-containing protein [Actinomycetota bacterium]